MPGRCCGQHPGRASGSWGQAVGTLPAGQTFSFFTFLTHTASCMLSVRYKNRLVTSHQNAVFFLLFHYKKEKSFVSPGLLPLATPVICSREDR